MKIDPRSWSLALSRVFSRPLFWSALGVLSASVVMLNLNVLSARFYKRWDVTDSQAFTLSTATKEILRSLSDSVSVVVFLSRSDRLLVDVRQMLSEYQAHTNKLDITYVDPDRDPAEFLALQQKFGIVAGKTEDGKLLTDASVVLAHEDKRWFLTPEDLMSMDAEGNVEPRLELGLTEGIAQVTRGKPLTVCFSEGHQEASLDDAGPHGLVELRLRLGKSNLTVESINLGTANPRADLFKRCALVVVAGPKAAFAEAAAQALRSYFALGGRLLLMLDPIVDDSGRLRASGLEPVALSGGISLGRNFVIERNAELRLPNGVGEAFLATPESHAITQGLLRPGNRIDFRVLLVGAQTLGTTESSHAKPLLKSSEQSFALDELGSVHKGDNSLLPLSSSESGPYYLGLASEGPAQSGSPQGNSLKQRMVVTGAVNPAWSRNWQDPSLAGNRLFVENAIAWLLARPALVSVPRRRSLPAGLSLTEDSLSDVLAYVMLYMPLTAGLMAAFVLFRRKNQEARSRRNAAQREDRA